jgi:hypothetical protein
VTPDRVRQNSWETAVLTFLAELACFDNSQNVEMGLMAKKCWFFIVGISANTSESMHPDDAVRGLDVDGIFV